LTRQIHKTALDAETLVPFEYVSDIDTWTDTYKWPIIALEQSDKSVMLPNYIPPDRFALLLGEEVDGIPASLLNKCSKIIEIPMFAAPIFSLLVEQYLKGKIERTALLEKTQNTVTNSYVKER
jgi:tRNA G18 (ribose-2'-O)-methylase SpoU